MQKFHFLILAALVLSACSPAFASPTFAPTLAPPQPSVAATKPSVQTPASTGQMPASEAEVPRISVTDAKAALDGGQAIIVDVRSKPAYEASHIKGARYIGDLEDSQLNLTVPKDQWIIPYCT